MTVGELIEKLSTLDPSEKIVFANCEEGDVFVFDSIKKPTLYTPWGDEVFASVNPEFVEVEADYGEILGAENCIFLDCHPAVNEI